MRALDYFAPVGCDNEQRRRSRLLVASAYGLCVFALPLIVQLYVHIGSFNPTMAAFLIGAPVMAINPLILRRSGSLTLAGVLVCCELLMILGVQAYFNGGIAAAALLWCFNIPLIANFLVGPRFGALCAALVVALATALYAAGEGGFAFPRPLSDAQMRWWTLAGLCSATLFATLLGYLHEVSRKATHSAMDQAIMQRDLAEQTAAFKATFLANMSHEIRTPMNAVIGMTSLLLDTRLSAKQREYVETVRSSGEVLLSVVNDILDYSKIEAGQLQLEEHPFALRACIEDVLGLIAPSLHQPDVELSYFIDEAVPEWLLGDVTRLRQILLNLLSNAVKFTQRGEIVVIAGVVEDDGAMKRDGIDAGSERLLSLQVQDTGIGIPHDRQDDIFAMFTQVDASTTRQYGGTGLGLSIVSRLVELMEGSVSLRSEVGVGTTFEIRFALRPCGPARDKLPSDGQLIRGRRALIVDDDATSRRPLALQTRAWGMHTAVAADAEQALARLDSDGPFHVALVGHRPPSLDGLELARTIRQRFDASALPLLLLAGEAPDSDALAHSDVLATLPKPVLQSVLYNALMRALASHRDTPPPSSATGWSIHEVEAPHSTRILLAEDNLVNQKVALAMLGRLGYRADVAANGQEVLRALARQRYDIVLMDVQMPEMDGLKATRIIRKRYATGPYIVAMTAGAMQSDREACMEAGMDDYICKPVRPTDLSLVLGRLTQGLPVSQRGGSAALADP